MASGPHEETIRMTVLLDEASVAASMKAAQDKINEEMRSSGSTPATTDSGRIAPAGKGSPPGPSQDAQDAKRRQQKKQDDEKDAKGQGSSQNVLSPLLRNLGGTVGGHFSNMIAHARGLGSSGGEGLWSRLRFSNDLANAAGVGMGGKVGLFVETLGGATGMLKAFAGTVALATGMVKGWSALGNMAVERYGVFTPGVVAERQKLAMYEFQNQMQEAKAARLFEANALKLEWGLASVGSWAKTQGLRGLGVASELMTDWSFKGVLGKLFAPYGIYRAWSKQLEMENASDFGNLSIDSSFKDWAPGGSGGGSVPGGSGAGTLGPGPTPAAPMRFPEPQGLGLHPQVNAHISVVNDQAVQQAVEQVRVRLLEALGVAQEETRMIADLLDGRSAAHLF
jgi:hypothetical protein